MIFNPMIPIPLALGITLISIVIVLIKAKHKPVIEIALIISLFILNVRPMVPTKTSKVLSTNLDFIFAVDTTISMNAEDYQGGYTRLFGVKKDLKNIITKFPGARYTLITFDNRSKITVPATKDISIVEEAIDVMRPYNSFYAHGSNYNSPLNDIGRIAKSSTESKDKITILFFVSDGEITRETEEKKNERYNLIFKDEFKSYTEIRDYIDAGAVLGYGTEQGGYMREKDLLTNSEVYIHDPNNYSNEPAKSYIDEKNLQQIADNLGLKYINMNDSTQIDSIISKIKTLENSGIEHSVVDSYGDLYYILVIPPIVLLFILLNRYKEMI